MERSWANNGIQQSKSSTKNALEKNVHIKFNNNLKSHN